MRSFLFLLFLLAFACRSAPRYTVMPPAGERYCLIDPAGETVLPNGRLLTPMGATIRIAPHPFGLALSPDGRRAVTANSGIRPFSITVVDGIDGVREPAARQIPEGALDQPDLLRDVFMGLAVSPDNRSVYVAGGQANCVYRFDLQTGMKLDSIDCANAEFTDGYLGDLALNRAGTRLYIVDQINFQLLEIETTTRRVLHRVAVGRYPFGVALSPDERRVYVANVGMYAYAPLRARDTANRDFRGAAFATSGFNTEKSRAGYETDEYAVPGLGDPNAPESFSVWTVDLAGATPRVSARTKTGFLVGEKIEGVPAVGGSSPNSIVATAQYVFVSNGNNDCVSVLDAAGDRVVRNIFLKPLPELSGQRGVIPFGLALSPDRRRLFVAEAGINAVGVIDVPSLAVVGHLPVGWFPSKLAVTPDGRRLVVANAKGYGSGPNGGSAFREGPEGTYIGHLMHGSVTVLDIPVDSALPRWTRRVLDNNFVVGTREPGRGTGHPIKYLVFISKENRTYDEVFGQVRAGRGDPALARYGAGRTFARRSGSDTLRDVTVMPNHLELARRFGLADNFYVDSDVSADGHRWLVNTYPNEWVEAEVPASYGVSRNRKAGSKAPGRWAFVGSSGAIYPEDYNEAGSMWDHLERNRISFFNFGFGTELAGSYADSSLKYGGVRVRVNYPVPAPLFVRSSVKYPTYNMAIPDQFRASIFIDEYKSRWLDRGKRPPRVLTVLLPQDHGAGERPHAGYPYRESYMADNDLALGRIVEFLSRTPYWKNMAIIVTEDDAQDGQDHVDAHRSILMAISPWAKRGHVSHVHYSFGSIFKTMWNMLGVPYLNQYDASAADLGDFFTDRPDFTPYNAVAPDQRLFDPRKALTPFDEGFDWKALHEGPKLDNVEDFIRKQ